MTEVMHLLSTCRALEELATGNLLGKKPKFLLLKIKKSKDLAEQL